MRANVLLTGTLTVSVLKKNVSLDQSLINLQLLFYCFSDLERLKELSWQVRNPRMFSLLSLINLINVGQLFVLVHGVKTIRQSGTGQHFIVY